jgi:hypothetical protein
MCNLLAGLHKAWFVLSHLGFNWTGSFDWTVQYACWLLGTASMFIMASINHKQYREDINAIQ